MTDLNLDKRFSGEEGTLVRSPLDPDTGRPYQACRYALFPGLSLAQSEPELVVLLYDSIRQQYPDTAMFLYKGREGADPLLNRKWSERLLTQWRNLGKPKMIITSPEDMKFFRGILTEIPTVSLYDELLANNISGGCSRELYRLSEPADYGFEAAIRELAENMGAVIYDPAADSPGDGSDPAGPAIKAGDAVHIPYLTSSMDIRNAMKKRGFDAVHILELIYGMGASNAHLAHTHDSDHAHGHDHEAPKVRDWKMGPSETVATEALYDSQTQKENLLELQQTLLSLFWGE